jgi:hypothetical protein
MFKGPGVCRQAAMILPNRLENVLSSYLYIDLLLLLSQHSNSEV